MSRCYPFAMKGRLIRWTAAITLVVGSFSCSPQSNPVTPAAGAPQQTGDGFLTIRTTRVEYLSPGGVDWNVLGATLANPTDRVFYARLVDAMSPGDPPPALIAVEGSDGFLERWNSPAWDGLARPIAIEGTGLAVLRPHTAYSLYGYFRLPPRPRIGPDPAISLRFRIQYFDGLETLPEQEHEDFSNTFVLAR